VAGRHLKASGSVLALLQPWLTGSLSGETVSCVRQQRDNGSISWLLAEYSSGSSAPVSSPRHF